MMMTATTMTLMLMMMRKSIHDVGSPDGCGKLMTRMIRALDMEEVEETKPPETMEEAMQRVLSEGLTKAKVNRGRNGMALWWVGEGGGGGGG